MAENKELLRSYFAAFSNLYGITPLYWTLRIIQKQNPELELTEADFLSFVSEIEQEEHFYIIAGAEDIYIDVDDPTPPMKREIIAEYLYAVDDFDSYDELRTEQEGKPFYIPEKETLLKYQNDGYVEETKESLAFGASLRDKLKLKMADDILGDLQFAARTEDNDPHTDFPQKVDICIMSTFYSAKRVENRMRRLFSGGAAENGRAGHGLLP